MNEMITYAFTFGMDKKNWLKLREAGWNGHVHKYQTHFWGFVQADFLLSF